MKITEIKQPEDQAKKVSKVCSDFDDDCKQVPDGIHSDHSCYIHC